MRAVSPELSEHVLKTHRDRGIDVRVMCSALVDVTGTSSGVLLVMEELGAG